MSGIKAGAGIYFRSSAARKDTAIFCVKRYNEVWYQINRPGMVIAEHNGPVDGDCVE